MEYNKFIYKINKYKSFQKDSDKKRKEHYQKKIDFYYNKIDEIVTNIKNHKGGAGAFTDADLMQFINPTTIALEQKLNQTANIAVFQGQQQKYEGNHQKIIAFLNKLLVDNDKLKDYNNGAHQELDKIRKEMKQMDDKHRKEIEDKLSQIKRKVDAQKNLSLADIETKYGINIKI